MPAELGDPPEPSVEPPERFPGGVDALEDEGKYGDIPDEPLTPDLPISASPATDDEVPDEIAQPDEADDAEGEEETSETGGKSDALGEDTPV